MTERMSAPGNFCSIAFFTAAASPVGAGAGVWACAAPARQASANAATSGAIRGDGR